MCLLYDLANSITYHGDNLMELLFIVLVLFFSLIILFAIKNIISNSNKDENNTTKNHESKDNLLDNFKMLDDNQKTSAPITLLPPEKNREPIVELLAKHNHQDIASISSKFMLDCLFNKFQSGQPIFKILSYNKSQDICVYKAEHISNDNIQTELMIESEMLRNRQIKKIRSNSGINLKFYTHNLVGDYQREIVAGDKIYIMLIIPNENCMITIGFEFKQTNLELIAEKISEEENYFNTTLLQDKKSLIKQLKNNIERFELVEEMLGISLDSMGFEVTNQALEHFDLNLSLEIKLIDFENKVKVDLDITLFDENNNIIRNSWVKNVHLSSTSPFYVGIWGFSCSQLPTRIRLFPKGEKY